MYAWAETLADTTTSTDMPTYFHQAKPMFSYWGKKDILTVFFNATQLWLIKWFAITLPAN